MENSYQSTDRSQRYRTAISRASDNRSTVFTEHSCLQNCRCKEHIYASIV